MSSNMKVKDIRPHAKIEYKNMKFLITDRPNDQTIHAFIQVSMLDIELAELHSSYNHFLS